nr:uncharacterized protein LOC111843362 isoform X2 [Paramormyrops kingsleyae]
MKLKLRKRNTATSLSVPPLCIIVYRENLMKLDCLNKMDLLVPGPDERGGRMMFRLLLLLYLGHCLPGADSEAIYADVGDTVMLPCYGAAATDIKEVNVLWKLNGKPACWDINGTWCENSHLVNRTQLGSIRQNNFSLIINTVRNEDEGVYTCEISEDKKQTIHLVVKGSRQRRDAVKRADSEPFCNPSRAREDTPGSETKEKQVSNENLLGLTSRRERVFLVSVGMLVIALVIVASFTKRQWNRQRDKKLPNLRPSEASLMNDASVSVEGCSADKKMGEPAV